MRKLLLTLAMLLLATPGFATEGYESYVAKGFGFKLDLPTTGFIENPQTEGWMEDPETAFVWFSEADEPVWSIDGTVYDVEEPVTDEMLVEFMSSFAEGFVGYMLESEIECELLSNEPGYEFAGYDWYGLDFTMKFEDAVEGLTGFGTAVGSKIYLITFSYSDGLSDEVQDFGLPVMESFKLTKQNVL